MKPVTGRVLLIMAALAAGSLGAFSVPGGGEARAQANMLPQGVLDKEWHLATYQIARAAPRDVSQYKSTIKFTADGRVGGYGGCNGFGGEYQAGADGSLTLGQLISTQIYCEGGASDWELLYFQSLNTVSEYKLEGDQLQLIFNNGQGVLAYDAPGTTQPSESAVTGTVTYRQRIALSPDAVVTVRLLDVSIADAPAEMINEQTITSPGQVPIPFKLPYDPAQIIANHTYAVSAEISDHGSVMFRTTTSYPVITGGHPTQVELVLEMTGGTGAGQGVPGMPTTGGDEGNNAFYVLVGAALGMLALGWRLRRMGRATL